MRICGGRWRRMRKGLPRNATRRTAAGTSRPRQIASRLSADALRRRRPAERRRRIKAVGRAAWAMRRARLMTIRDEEGPARGELLGMITRLRPCPKRVHLHRQAARQGEMNSVKYTLAPSARIEFTMTQLGRRRAAIPEAVRRWRLARRARLCGSSRTPRQAWGGGRARRLRWRTRPAESPGTPPPLGRGDRRSVG